MGKVSGNWITGAHSGRACHNDDIYTKVNKKTGACYSVKLCNPNTEMNDTQLSIQDAFKAVSQGISAWINTNKASLSEDYKKVKAIFDRQTKYSSLRGMMIAKGMYTVASDKKTVTVDITARSVFKTAFGIEINTSASNGNQSVAGKRTLSLSVSPTGAGTVSGAGQYDNGASASISATANSGYTFARWNDGETNANRSVVMDADKSLSAIFTANSDTDPADENNLY